MIRKQMAGAPIKCCNDVLHAMLDSNMLQASQSVQSALKQAEEARAALARQLSELQHQHSGEVHQR